MSKNDKTDRKQQKILMTQDGLTELKAELEELREAKRPKAVDRLQAAREMGDLTENGEYASAGQDLAFIDGRIAEIEDIIRHAEVVSKSRAKKSVKIGSKVILKAGRKKVHYTVVGEWEADPKERKISHNSPLGKALLDKKVGEAVEVNAPAGKIKYVVKEIE